MAATNEHAAYLARSDYAVPEGLELAPADAALLRRYGHWMEALASGRIEPTTPDQAHFVEAARGEAEPRTDFERAWARLSQHREPPAALFTRLLEARARAEHLSKEKEAERERVLLVVKADLDALEARYAAETADAARELKEAEDAVRAEVLLAGKSIRHGPLNAVYARGRAAWDRDRLEKLAEKTPEILDCRTLSAPSVQLRYQKEG